MGIYKSVGSDCFLSFAPARLELALALVFLG